MLVRKVTLIGLGILGAVAVSAFVILKISFGPLHSLVSIDLGPEGKIICRETYNADFAEEFYDVTMTLETDSGEKWNLGMTTFHNPDWREQIKVTRIKNWLVLPLEPGSFAQIKTLNTLNGHLNDTTLSLSPTSQSPETSKIIDFSADMIEVAYEFNTSAQYPSEILVSQRFIFVIDTADGKLKTKQILDQVPQ